jgi:hypothetical protein
MRTGRVEDTAPIRLSDGAKSEFRMSRSTA